MLRNLLIFSFCACVSAAIPLVLKDGRGAAGRPAPAAEQPVSPPRATAASLSGRKAEIRADGRGHFLAEFRLNGRRVPALVDTGATFVAINRSTARSIGIALAPADFRLAMNTANGVTRAAAVTLAHVELGRIHVGDVEAVVLEDDALSGTLIGMSFLKRLDRFRVENGALLLAQ